MGHFKNNALEIRGSVPIPMPSFSPIPEGMTKYLAGHKNKFHYYSSARTPEALYALKRRLSHLLALDKYPLFTPDHPLALAGPLTAAMLHYQIW